jgi:hypothetical protein
MIESLDPDQIRPDVDWSAFLGIDVVTAFPLPALVSGTLHAQGGD